MQNNNPSNEDNPVSALSIMSVGLSLSTFFIGPFGFISGIICGHLARRNDKTQNVAIAGLLIGYSFIPSLFIFQG